jgi:hypothetical protein
MYAHVCMTIFFVKKPPLQLTDEVGVASPDDRHVPFSQAE